MVVEDVFYAKNVRTTVVLGHARGVVLLAGAQARIDVYEFPPAEENAMTCGFGGNSKGEVVGHYQRRGAAIHGFLLSRGEFLQLDYPDSIRTDAYGINDAGVIVGISTDKEQRVHGFILRR